jgi:hypothetical protein
VNDIENRGDEVSCIDHQSAPWLQDDLHGECIPEVPDRPDEGRYVIPGLVDEMTAPEVDRSYAAYVLSEFLCHVFDKPH